MTTNKYATAKIYKVVDNSYTMCYYGSTVQPLSKRISNHRMHYKLFGEGKFNHRLTVFDIFDAHGAENCKIELIEEFPCESKEQLNKREGFYIQNNECVNKVIAGQTLAEWKSANREHLQQYQANYTYANLQRVREIKRRSWHKHKDRALEKITCEVCGSVCIRQHVERHRLSRKHAAAETMLHAQAIEEKAPAIL